MAIGIALSTAKIIVKRFRREGTVFVRKEEQKMLTEREEKSQILEEFEHQ